MLCSFFLTFSCACLSQIWKVANPEGSHAQEDDAYHLFFFFLFFTVLTLGQL